MSFFGIDPAKILVLNDLLVFDMGQSVQNIGTKGLTRKILWNKDLASEFERCNLRLGLNWLEDASRMFPVWRF